MKQLCTVNNANLAFRELLSARVESSIYVQSSAIWLGALALTLRPVVLALALALPLCLQALLTTLPMNWLAATCVPAMMMWNTCNVIVSPGLIGFM